MGFEDVADLARQALERRRQGFEHGQSRCPGNAAAEPLVGGAISIPIGRHALIAARRDHLIDVAPGEADALAQMTQNKLLCLRFGGEALEFGGAGDDRREVEAEGLFDLARLPFPCVAFAIGAVAANDEPAFDQRGQMPPAAFSPPCRWRAAPNSGLRERR